MMVVMESAARKCVGGSTLQEKLATALLPTALRLLEPIQPADSMEVDHQQQIGGL